MKKILSFFILSLFFISCSSDDNFVEETDRGFIEMEYNGEKLFLVKNLITDGFRMIKMIRLHVSIQQELTLMI